MEILNRKIGYYEEYLNKVLELTKMTTKENSILVSFSIEDGKCQSKVELLEQDGTKGDTKSVSFACTDSFYTNFLEVLVKEYSSSIDIVLVDIIDMDGDNQFTFRMVGESNDLFSIDGISKDYAYKLKNIVESIRESKVTINNSSEAGISNAFGLVMLGSIMVVIFLTLMLFKW